MNPKDPNRNAPAQVEPGYVFALVPPQSRQIYDECLRQIAKALALTTGSTLDFGGMGRDLDEISRRIVKAEIIIADVTGYDPEVMCELGMSMTIKDRGKILLLRNENSAGDVRALPQLPVTLYSSARLDDLRRRLNAILREVVDYLAAGSEPDSASKGSDQTELAPPEGQVLNDAIEALYEQLIDLTSRVAAEPELKRDIIECKAQLQKLQAQETQMMQEWFEDHVVLDPARGWKALREARRILGDEDVTA